LWRQPWTAQVIASGDIAAVYRLLQQVGISQRRIAASTGQSQSEISEILRGRRVRDIRVLTRIVGALDLPRQAFGLAPTPVDADAEDGPHRGDPASDQIEAAATVALPVRCRCGGPVEADQPLEPGPSIDEIPGSVPQADIPAGPPSPLIEVLAQDASRRLTVALWTGVEVRMLRLARRMSVRGFADHLGVSDRMVSKWEAIGRPMTPNPVNQEALDTSLNMATLDQRARFAVLWRQAWPAGSVESTKRPTRSRSPH
jgi:transcriptional regulator with XRE-family HTH domain